MLQALEEHFKDRKDIEIKLYANGKLCSLQDLHIKAPPSSKPSLFSCFSWSALVGRLKGGFKFIQAVVHPKKGICGSNTALSSLF
ncbi:hypothetical protein HHE03_05520 [Helicobacter heilmannii]|nr:hypothetical protein HHE014_05940 [Helicobacter heilmannii]CRF48958.1 hypothetical protein HHE03_05520 [Helicobacter heilmannii]